MKRKDITFLIGSMAGGGAQKVILLLMNELCARGWKVTLLCKAEGPFLKKISSSISLIALKQKNVSKNILAIAKYLRTSNPSFFYSSMTFVNVTAGLAAVLANYKGTLILSEHNNLVEANKYNKNFVTGFMTLLAKVTYKRADAIVCVSQGVKDATNEIIPDLKKTVTIYNPIESFSIIEKDTSNEFKIISMGRLAPQKNFALLINAFSIVIKNYSRNEQISLYILGEGPERDELSLLINKLELQNKVFLPGFVNDPAEILSSSNLFVLSSDREGFGNVLVEALSCGLPVISTDCPSGPAEILQDGKFGKLVPVNDVESMAAAIIEVLNKRDEYLNECEKEKRILRAKDFSVEKITDQYELLFEYLTAN